MGEMCAPAPPASIREMQTGLRPAVVEAFERTRAALSSGGRRGEDGTQGGATAPEAAAAEAAAEEVGE